jgi:hypothetical protein
MAFGSNLSAGWPAAIEYVAPITGYQALLIVVAVLYGLAYLLAHWLVRRPRPRLIDGPPASSVPSAA